MNRVLRINKPFHVLFNVSIRIHYYMYIAHEIGMHLSSLFVYCYRIINESFRDRLLRMSKFWTLPSASSMVQRLTVFFVNIIYHLVSTLFHWKYICKQTDHKCPFKMDILQHFLPKTLLLNAVLQTEQAWVWRECG